MPSRSGVTSGASKFQPRRPSLSCSLKPHRDRKSSCISTEGRLRQRNRLGFSVLSSINIWPGGNTSTTSPASAANGWTWWERPQARDRERLRSPSSPSTELTSDLSSTTEQRRTTAHQPSNSRNWIGFSTALRSCAVERRQLRLHQHYRLSAEKLPFDCDDYSSRSSSPSKWIQRQFISPRMSSTIIGRLTTAVSATTRNHWLWKSTSSSKMSTWQTSKGNGSESRRRGLSRYRKSIDH